MRSVSTCIFSLWLAVAALPLSGAQDDGTTVSASSATPGNNVLDDLRETHGETEKWLKGYMDDTTELKGTMEKTAGELQEEQEAMTAIETQLLQRVTELQDMLAELNTRKLSHLMKQLNDTVRSELQSRSSSASIAVGDEHAAEVIDPVSVEELPELIAADALLDDTEAALQNWMVQAVKNEVLDTRIQNAQAEATIAAALRMKKKERQQMEAAKKVETPTEVCITPTEGAQLVHEKVLSVQEVAAAAKLREVDLLAGATVVHELTSDTYVPPPQPDDLMGNVWWRQYIPQDWERYVLPTGWEEWNVALPPAVLRVLNIRGAATLPPEAILDSNLHPGACWPLSGNKGYVTLRLAQPMQRFDGMTIEHAPLLWDSVGGSAPKAFEITGYPPCDNDCNGFGFDTTKGKVLTAFDFSTSSKKSSQTFEALPDLPQEGSCSEVKPSCDGEDDPLKKSKPISGGESENDTIAAIRIDILSNQGNKDYTCLYGARMQGKTA